MSKRRSFTKEQKLQILGEAEIELICIYMKTYR
jgi:hypothetical protein